MLRGEKRIAALLAAVFLSILPFPAASAAPTRGISVVAEDPATGERAEVGLYDKMYAVIIGIDRYPRLKPGEQLTYAVKDARAVAKVLREKYSFEEVVTLENEAATAEGIKRTLLEEVGSRVSEGDAVFVFFAGHGYTIRGADGRDIGWIVPSDGTLSRSDYRNISMEEIRGTISGVVKARHIFFVIDACYGGLLLPMRAGEERPPRTLAYLREVTNEPVRQVLTAGDDKQTVLDDGPRGHSVFTGRLIEKLEATDDYITASELSLWLEERVFSDAQSRNHKQTPKWGRFYGRGDFVFVPSSRKREEDVRREKDETERELVELRRRAEEARKKKDAAGAERIVEQERAAEARKRALELKEAELAAQAKRRETEAEAARKAEEKRKQSAIEEEARLRELKEEAEKLRSEIKSGDENDIHTASARVKELTKQISEIEASYDKASAEALARIEADYNARIATVKAEKRSMFETEKEFRERIEETVRKLAGERASEKESVTSKFRAEREKQTASARAERSSFVERLYEEEVEVDLKEYDAEKEEFEVIVTTIAEKAKTLLSSGQKNPPKQRPWWKKITAIVVNREENSETSICELKFSVPRSEARSLWENRGGLTGSALGVLNDLGEPQLVAVTFAGSGNKNEYFSFGHLDNFRWNTVNLLRSEGKPKLADALETLVKKARSTSSLSLTRDPD